MKVFLFLLSWIWAILTDLLSLLLIMFLHLFSFLQIKKRFHSKQPILLVHGYLNTGSVWRYIEWGFYKKKIGPVFTLDLKNPFGSIEEHAETVAQKVLEIEKETGQKKITLIGHSMGGIVSTVYAVKKAPLGKVSQVITLGSPLKGTYLANIALGKDGKEMRRKSPLLQEMQKLVASNQKTLFYHIISKTDTLVIPYESGWIEGPFHTKRVVSGMGHVGLLFSPKIRGQVIDWIQNP